MEKLMNYKTFIFFLLYLFLTSSSSKLDKTGHSFCPFCSTDVLERQTFYEDELVLALYTHKPIFPGHCLIIPKSHIERFDDLNEDEILQIYTTIKKIHTSVSSVFKTSAYMLLQKNGKEVGQSVPHLHFHYIPRKKNTTSPWKFVLNMFIANCSSPINRESMQKIVDELREEMCKL